MGSVVRRVLQLGLIVALFTVTVPVVGVLSASPAAAEPILTLGYIGSGLETGTPNFNGFGNCTGGEAVAPPVPYPGDDCGPDDNVVRTGDVVNVGLSLAVSGIPGGEAVDDAFFVQTLTPNDVGAAVSFLSVPPTCESGVNPDTGVDYDPQSEILGPNVDGSYELVCNVGRIDGPSTSVFFQMQVAVAPAATNNSTFTMSETPCPAGYSTNGCSSTTGESVTAVGLTETLDAVVSAAPSYDLAKNRRGDDLTDAYPILNDPGTPDDDIAGVRQRYYITIEMDQRSDGKGFMPLTTDPIRITDEVFLAGTSVPVPGYEILNFTQTGTAATPCNPLPWGGRQIPYGRTGINGNSDATNSVADSGTFSCTQPGGPGSPIEIELTGTDTSGTNFPETGTNNSTALQPPYYVVSGYIYVWYPAEVIDRFGDEHSCAETAVAGSKDLNGDGDTDDNGESWEAQDNSGFTEPYCGPVDLTGTLNVQNCLSYTETPVSTDTLGNPVPNYAGGPEPGQQGEGDPSSSQFNNNCESSAIELRTSGSFGKYLTAGVKNSANLGLFPPPGGGGTNHTGDYPLQPTQYFGSWVTYRNTGLLDMTGVAICDNLDNLTSTLAPIQQSGSWVPTDSAGRVLPVHTRGVNLTNPDGTPLNVIVEYASGPAGTAPTDHVPWDTDHLAGGLNPLIGTYNSATFGTQKSTGCTDAEGNWTTDPYSFDTDDTLSLQKIRSVRARIVDDAGNEPAFNPADRVTLWLQLEARNTFWDGPNAGTPIPPGTLHSNFGTYRSNERTSGNWDPITYDPNVNNSSIDGDRAIFTRGYVRVEKSTVTYETYWEDVTADDLSSVAVDQAGEGFQFRLEPAAISNVDPPVANLSDVVVTDVLPTWLTFDPNCTAAVTGAGLPLVQTNTPNSGETTLTWNLGTLTPGVPVDPIDFCVLSDALAPDGTSAVNTATISSPEDASPESERSATATVQLTQSGGFRLVKYVDSPLDPQENGMIFTLRWLNTSNFVSLRPPLMIDVLPHNLDGVGEGALVERNPPSDFAGTLAMSAAPTADTPGTFFYTKRLATQVSDLPEDPSNPFASAPYDITHPELVAVPADANDDGQSDAGKTVWCLETSFGQPGCPLDFAEVTSFMFVGAEEVGPGEGGAVEFDMVTANNAHGDFYANSFTSFTPTLPGQVNASNIVDVAVVSVSLGDLVWYDYDNDGVYEPSQGEALVPDGVQVNLMDPATNAVVAGVAPTTTVDGRYLFTGLEPGDYYVMIPASEFGIGGPLAGAVPTQPRGLANDDLNEAADQHGYNDSNGAVITDVVTLGFTFGPPDPLTGNVDILAAEPVGEDVAALDITTRDDLSNLTLDIGLVGTPAIELVKQVNGADANSAPGIYLDPAEPVTWTFVVKNTGEADLFAVTVTDDQIAADAVDIVCPAHLDDAGTDNVIDALRVGESVTCAATAASGAVTGQYTNTGTVTATDALGGTVEDDDPANYFGVAASIDVEKTTNNVQADTGNGPLISAPDPVTWAFTVENTGNVDLAGVVVSDTRLASSSITCAGSGTNIIPLLEPGAVNAVICTATAPAVGGQHNNSAGATGNPVDDDGNDLPGVGNPRDADPSAYYGVVSAISIEKDTNGDDADTGTGPLVEVGDPVTWTYVVSNDGTVPLIDVTVNDDQLSAADIACDNHLADVDGNNVIDVVRPGDQVSCTASGTAVIGQYENLADVAGTPAFASADGAYDPTDPSSWPSDPAALTVIAGADDVIADDPSHYYGWQGPADLMIEKSTNSFDADTPAGPYVIEGGGVAWTYEVRNTGALALTAVEVTDNRIAAADISCPTHRADNNLDNVIALLVPGDVVTCIATGTALTDPPDGQYENDGSATGNPVVPAGAGVGIDPTNPATYPDDVSLYRDLVALADPADSDPSHYFASDPADPGIDIEKDTNGDQADASTGPFLVAGDAVTWTFVVDNVGGWPLAPVTVTDDQLTDADISCDAHLDDAGGNNVIDLLFPGDSVTCRATGVASANGLYTNIGTAVGEPVQPVLCVDCDPLDFDTWPTDPTDYTAAKNAAGAELNNAADADPSHYFVATTGIGIEKDTNGDQADSAPGPFIDEDATVTWTFVVENAGTVPLADVTVTDDQLADADISCAEHLADADGDNVIDIVEPFASVVCTATGAAALNQYQNTGSVIGTPVAPPVPADNYDPADPATYPPLGSFGPIAGLDDPVAVDPSHYFGIEPSIDVEKTTNTVQSDAAPGEAIANGESVTWTYVVNNDGNVALVDVLVIDDQLGNADITCAAHRDDIDGNNTIAVLLPGDAVTCSATSVASGGQYANIATALGDPSYPTSPPIGFDPTDASTYPTSSGDFTPIPNTPSPSDVDPSHYYGSGPGVDIEKSTNTIDADRAPGPAIAPGGAVVWDFVVTNTGTSALTDATVTDTVIAASDIDCGAPDNDNVIPLLLPGTSVTCSATGTADVEQHANTASVIGDPAWPSSPPAGFDPDVISTWPLDASAYGPLADADPPTDDDDSHYFAPAADVTIEKATNTVDADSTPGVPINPGAGVIWTFEVTNDGATALADVTVTDDLIASADIECGGGTNVIPVLVPDQSVTCTASGIAIAGQHSNTASVIGNPVFPTTPALDFDVDDPASWPTAAAEYADIADLASPTATDPSNYFGLVAALDIEKATNTIDADEGPGVALATGDPVVWTYVIENTGTAALVGVPVIDDQLPNAAISCAVHRDDFDRDNVLELLVPGDIVICEATGVAASGLYENTATTLGDPVFPTNPSLTFDPGDPATYPSDASDYTELAGALTPRDTDDSHHYGVATSMTLEKATNGVDADAEPGPAVALGGPVTWDYVVVNTGTTALLQVVVTDDIVAASDIDCGIRSNDAADNDNVIDVLVPGQSVTCTAQGVAVAGQYENTAAATGEPSVPASPPTDFDPTDPTAWPLDATDYQPAAGLNDPVVQDPSHYFGAGGAIAIEKETNGFDADTVTGPAIPVGGTVTWMFEVTNTGTAALAGVVVTDDQLAAVDIDCGEADGDNVITLLRPLEAVTCVATAPATFGQHTNTAAATGNPVFPSNLPIGFDSNDPATWPTDAAAYAEVPGEPDPNATDPSHYIGTEEGLELEKLTNGFDADTDVGPAIVEGAPVTWTFEVTNQSSSALADVQITDDTIAAADIDCGGAAGVASNVIALMLPTSSVTCTATGTAGAVPHANLATTTGNPVYPTDPPPGFEPDDPGTYPTDPADYSDIPGAENPVVSDPSHYHGSTTGINIEKATNGVDADQPSGPFIDSGAAVTWTFAVTNTGTVPLRDVVVVDDQGVTVACPATAFETDVDDVIALLLPGQRVECEATGSALDFQYSNLGSVTGSPVWPNDPGDNFDPANPSTYPPLENLVPIPGLTDPTDDDPSNYYGVDPAITIEKATNGVDADTGPGVSLQAGDPVIWTFVVRNTGTVALASVEVADDQLAAAEISCDDNRNDVNGDSIIDLLVPGDLVTCQASGVAISGQHANVATAVGDPTYPTNPAADFDPTRPWTYPDDPSDYTEIPDVDSPQADDPSHYYGTTAGIDIEKATNTVDADLAPGPAVVTGEPVTWVYVVTNTGANALLDVVVTDDQLAAESIECGGAGGRNTVALLLPGASVTCTASGTAASAGYTNTASTSGDPVTPTDPPPGFDPADPQTWPTDPAVYSPVPGAPSPTDADDSHYFGVDAGVTIEKATNGTDADSAPGVALPVGSVVTWTFAVTNTGTTPLADVTVTDDQIAATDIDCGNGTNVVALLAPTESVSCTAIANVDSTGQHRNEASVIGGPVFPTSPSPDVDPNDPSSWPTDPRAYDPVAIDRPTDADPSHYIGTEEGLDLEKRTNNVDADASLGPALAIGDPVVWSFDVTNTSSTALADVTMTDSRIADIDIDCGAGSNVIVLLLPGRTASCSASGVVIAAGPHENIATATGTPVFPQPGETFDPDDPATWPTDPAVYEHIPDAPAPIASDPSHYIAPTASLTIEKATNGLDADTATGPFVTVGDTVTWTYEVTNTGTAPLANVVVSDDQGVSIICEPTALDAGGDATITMLVVGETASCEATAPASENQYMNLGFATGEPVWPDEPTDDFDPADPTTYPDAGSLNPIPRLETPSDNDPSHYFGANPAIDIEKATNGIDADDAPGVAVTAGGTVEWTYRVENTGGVALVGVVVADNQISESDIACAWHLADVDEDNTINVLRPGDVVICTATGTAIDGRYSNTAIVVGEPVFPEGPPANFDPLDPDSYPNDASDYAEIPGASSPTEVDPSNYYGTTSGIELDKFTNGLASEEAPGAVITPGDPVTWTYVVENTGDIALLDVAVTDDRIAADAIDCGDGTNVIALLAPGAPVTCTAVGSAGVGPYANTAAASGVPAMPSDPPPGFEIDDPTTWPTDPAQFAPIPDAEPPTADDRSHYIGGERSIDIEKSTNGADADTGSGPTVPVGGAVLWTYVVTNLSPEPLADVTVSDDDPGVVISCEATTFDSDGDATLTLLLPGESVTCSAAGVAGTGQYTNVGSASGTAVWPLSPIAEFDPTDAATYPPLDELAATGGGPVTDADPSAYLGVRPSIDVEKATNGFDADDAPTPTLVGDAVIFTYVVRNTGSIVLLNVDVVDDQLATEDISCPSHRLDVVTDSIIDVLAPGDVVTCRALVSSAVGAYTNVVTVTGDPALPTSGDPSDVPNDPNDYTPIGDVPAVVDADPSQSFGLTTGIEIEKLVNGNLADNAPGISVPIGSTVTWTYEVTNTGTAALFLTTLGDSDPAVTVSCPETLLRPGATIVCSASGIATAGDYMNVAEVEAIPQWPTDPGATFDPADPATWPADLDAYAPVSSSAGPVDPVTASDPAHHVGVPAVGAPTPTPTQLPIATATPVPSATPTRVPTATPVPSATPTRVPTATPVPSATPTRVPTATPVPSATPTRVPTATPVLSATPTRVPTATPTATPVLSATPTRVPTATPTATPAGLPTATPNGQLPGTPTATLIPAPASSPTPTLTGQLPGTPTATPGGSATATPDGSPTATTTAVATSTPSSQVPATPTSSIVAPRPSPRPAVTPSRTAGESGTPQPLTPLPTVTPVGSAPDGAPTVAPADGAPTVTPAGGAPTGSATVTPVGSAAGGSPTATPAGGSPTVTPVGGSPTVSPAAGSPSPTPNDLGSSGGGAQPGVGATPTPTPTGDLAFADATPTPTGLVTQRPGPGTPRAASPSATVAATATTNVVAASPATTVAADPTASPTPTPSPLPAASATPVPDPTLTPVPQATSTPRPLTTSTPQVLPTVTPSGGSEAAAGFDDRPDLLAFTGSNSSALALIGSGLLTIGLLLLILVRRRRRSP